MPRNKLYGAVLLALLLGACSRQDETPAAASSPVAAAASSAASVAAPVTVEVCGQPVTYAQVPQRAVTYDIGITEMFLYLGLGDRLIGTAGIPENKEIDPAFREPLERIPVLSRKGMSVEAIVGAHADFVFAGWSYGFRPGEVTPELLASHGIPSYVLTESCIRVGARTRVSMDDTLSDLRNVARIFRVDAEVEPRIQGLERSLRDLERRTQGIKQRPRVFVYDSGEDIPTTSGRFGMPQAIIEAAGGTNIFDDIASNWPKGNWEGVVERNPEWIVIVDYGVPNAQGKIDFLLRKPELAQVDAIRHKRFFVLTYAEATPGPRNMARARALAAAMHPALMAVAKP
ncbi:iron ABC transporter substrate-binding protein [Comamonas phosphati]|nr:iron ABC transporter substrate-binding protein [Comamonas phosphati]